LVVGLFPVLMFSWAYEITPEGIKREAEIERSESITAHTGKKLNVVVIILLVAAIGLFAFDRFVGAPVPAPAVQTAPADPSVQIPQPSRGEAAATPQDADVASDAPPVVAVLPFTARTASGDGGRFLADGIHDDLLTQLAKLDAFRVISRTSVMEYLGTTKNMRQIGEELGAGHILEGGVQQAGNRVRINAQLIDATTDEHLWAETFERELTPDAIFEVQAEIAVAIARALQATLSDEAAAALAEAPTSSQAAYEAFLQGRLNTYVFGDEKRVEAVRQFENAVALDPEYAEAWGWLGFARVLQAWTDGITPEDDELIEGAAEAIQRARELDPDSPEADYAEAHYYYWVKADYPKALAIIEPLIESNPNNGDWMASRGWVNRRAGNWEAAVADLSRALELDPRNGFVAFELAAFYQQLRRWDEARAMLERALSISGNRDQYLAQLGMVELLCCGDLGPAREYARRMEETGLDTGPLAEVHLFEGRPGEALALLKGYGAGVSDAGPDGKWEGAIRALYMQGDAGRTITEARAYRQHLQPYLRKHPDQPRVHGALALAELALGNVEAAREHFGTMQRLRRPDAVLDGELAMTAADRFARFGDGDTAFRQMEKALEIPAGYTWQYVRLNSAYDGLRDDPRYVELEKRYGGGT
ncbi:MAG: tetratricopeptide repeat protein, partial [Gammaproteobacteria bacterium]